MIMYLTSDELVWALGPGRYSWGYKKQNDFVTLLEFTRNGKEGRKVEMGDLKTWVSDKLMSLLGYSQPTVVQYVITLSKKASSPVEIINQLVDLGLSSYGETVRFAKEIFSRVEYKASGPNLYQQKEREAAMLVRKQKTYTILEDEDNADDTILVASSPKKEDSRKKKFRKRSEPQDDVDDEVVLHRSKERQVRQRTVHEEDGGSESEEERLRDQREREELERHIRERDAAGTRKITDQKLTKKEEDEAIQRINALENDGIQTLRKVSRQEYLKKREQKKLEELRDDIEDGQYLFEGVKLSEAENREIRYKKQIYELVKKRTEESDYTNEYRMPEAYNEDGVINQEKRFAVAMQRYRDPAAEEKMNPFAEQEAWEEHQIGKATLKFGSKDKKRKHDDYEFVFEDQIDFIKATVIEGVNVEQDLPVQSPEAFAAKTTLEKLQVGTFKLLSQE